KIFFCEKRRRAAAKMHTQQRPLNQRRNTIEIKTPLGRKQIAVAFSAPVVARDDRVASAEGAKRFTKRKMKIERPGRRVVNKRFVQMREPLIGRRRIVPKRNGRVTRVARRRNVVLGE